MSSTGGQDGVSTTSGRRLAVRELTRFLPEVARLLYRVTRDGRVPWSAKAVAGAAVAYVVSPIDLLPDVVPGAGQLDDVLVVGKAIRYLLTTAGYEVLREHWTGSDQGFALLLVAAGVDD